MFAMDAFTRLVSYYPFQTVLDIGCGKEAPHAVLFDSFGKQVTAVDLNPPEAKFATITANYMEKTIEGVFDCVWLSHVLEHQLDVQSFLVKVSSNLKEGGVLAVTVPPLKHNIVGGHVSLWNMGLLLYRLILAGFDCRKAIGKKYGYNISVIVPKTTIEIDWCSLSFDSGDIEKLARYFPEGRDWGQEFCGDIESVSWHDRTELPQRAVSRAPASSV